MLDDAELIESMVPLIAGLAEDGNGAVALAGSRGKGFSDAQSDYDFRVYAHAYRGPDIERTGAWKRFEAQMNVWQSRNVRMDGIWMRRYAAVERDLAEWLSGTAIPKTFEWTIWGYHLPTDLASQRIVYDPEGVLADFRHRLVGYPEALRAAVIDHHRALLNYWASDFHYKRKVARGDLVFLAGLTSKLVHSILQIVFAHNRVYFPGDGWNLEMASELGRTPDQFVDRVTAILAPEPGQDALARQRARLIEMIHDVEALCLEQKTEQVDGVVDHAVSNQDNSKLTLKTEEKTT